MHARIPQGQFPPFPHTLHLIRIWIGDTQASRFSTVLHESRFPPKRELTAGRTQLFVSAMEQFIAGRRSLHRMATRGALHSAACRMEFASQPIPFLIRQEVCVGVRTSFEDAQQLGHKVRRALLARAAVHCILRRDIDCRAARTLQVQRRVGHGAKHASCHVRRASVLDAVRTDAMRAASTQGLKICRKCLADGAFLSKADVLPLELPTVLQDVEFGICQQHLFCPLLDPLPPSPRHFLRRRLCAQKFQRAAVRRTKDALSRQGRSRSRQLLV